MTNKFDNAHVVIGVIFLFFAAGLLIWSLWPDEGGLFSNPVKREPTIVAIVNGETIEKVEIIEEAMAQDVITSPEEYDLTSQDIASLLEDMIDQKLLAAEAKRRELDQGETAQRAMELAQNRALSEILLRNEVDRLVTEESLRELYEEQVRLGSDVEEVRARHILVASEEEARAAAARLAAGEDFVALAEELTTDAATRESGGDLGYFTKERMVPEFSEAAFKTEVGGVSQPFQSQFGWHILRVEDRRKQRLPSFEELRVQMLRYQTYIVVQGMIDRLREGAEIVYPRPQTLDEENRTNE